MTTEKTEPLILSSSPHIRSDISIPQIMYSVLLALTPATFVGIYYFGFDALQVILISTVTAILAEVILQRLMGQKIAIYDGSAAVTGLLLGLNLPPASPWWLSTLGSIIAIGLGKQIYGGLGYNIFNPALVARVILLISFPVQMTTWQRPHPLFTGTDVVTGATPLGILQEQRLLGKGVGEAANVNLIDAFVGNVGGSIGEVSAVAILIGGIYLLYKGYITWHIPFSYLGTVALFSGIFWAIDPAIYINPLFHLVTGGLMLGAFFMATDMVTSPLTAKGMLVFGVGCGLITIIIRMWGGYPEGVSFAILLMNGAVGLIDRYTQPVKFGERQNV